MLAEGIEGENKEKSVPVLATAELPAKSVDLTAINLTELVNGMLNTALKGTKKFFSLLSITSYSSFAFHKVSVAIYNISNLKNVDPSKFPMRYCYCLNNLTNDLTDFTALLVDIIGNSTSYLTEIFKSTSIVSVSQSNDSDCIYICVMAGRTGRNMSDFWEMIEKSPVINYTFSSNMSALLDIDSILPSLMTLREDPDMIVDEPPEDIWTFKTTRMPSWEQTVAWKGDEILSTRFPTWPKTVGLKGSGFPIPQLPWWLQTDASKGPGTTRPPPTPMESYDILPQMQPSTEMYPFWTQPASPEVTKVSIQTESYLPSLLLSTPVFRPEVLPKLHTASKLQANLSGDPVTNPNTIVNTSKKPKSEALFVKSKEEEEMGEEEEEEYGRQATWGSSYAVTQDMFLTLPLSSSNSQAQASPMQGKEPLAQARSFTISSGSVITTNNLELFLSMSHSNPASKEASCSPWLLLQLCQYCRNLSPMRAVLMTIMQSCAGAMLLLAMADSEAGRTEKNNMGMEDFFVTGDGKELSLSHRCPQATLKEPSMNSLPVTFMAQKINPCVMELCKFFQQCLCVNQRRNSRKEAMRYCIEYYSWFLKNATYICERVKRMAYSQTLKQKCLKNICKSF
ncbi:HERV-H LTR-associating protein 1 [Pangshura tecta]